MCGKALPFRYLPEILMALTRHSLVKARNHSPVPCGRPQAFRTSGGGAAKSILVTRSLPRAVLYPLFNLRQTRHHGVTHDLQTLSGNFVQRVVLRVPVVIGGELYYIKRIDARLQEWTMIVVAYIFASIYEVRAVTNLFRRLPDDILQPGRAQVCSSQTQLLITNHVQQDHRLHALQFVLLDQL